MTPDDLRGLGTQELHEHLVTGEPVDTDALAERVFHGTSLGLPRLLERRSSCHPRAHMSRL